MLQSETNEMSLNSFLIEVGFPAHFHSFRKPPLDGVQLSFPGILQANHILKTWYFISFKFKMHFSLLSQLGFLTFQQKNSELGFF